MSTIWSTFMKRVCSVAMALLEEIALLNNFYQ